ISSPDQFETVLKLLPFAQRSSGPHWKTTSYAQRAFSLTQAYDRHIAHYLKLKSPSSSALPNSLGLHLVQSAGMRYGENPHQPAGRFVIESADQSDAGLMEWRGEDHVRMMSYNNHVDASAALELCREIYQTPSGKSPNPRMNVCTFIKHTNACGVGVDA